MEPFRFFSFSSFFFFVPKPVKALDRGGLDEKIALARLAKQPGFVLKFGARLGPVRTV